MADAAIANPSAEIFAREIMTTGASGVAGETDYIDLLCGDSMTGVAIYLRVLSSPVSESGAFFCDPSALGRKERGRFVVGRRSRFGA